jgi:hypothetical protein
MNTFTAQELSDFYQKVADGGEAEYKVHIKGVWITAAGGPNLNSLTKEWRIKPAKKVIDLSVLIDSQIDCEFDDRGNMSSIAKLETIMPSLDDRAFVYINDKGLYWDRCQPRMNHIHAIDVEDDEEAGNIVENLMTAGFLLRFDTIHCIDRVVLLLSDFGKAEGYVMPWEAP